MVGQVRLRKVAKYVAKDVAKYLKVNVVKIICFPMYLRHVFICCPTPPKNSQVQARK